MSRPGPGVLDTNTLILLGRLDAMVAATALANQLAVFTCNPKDYDGIDGLGVVAVPHPDVPTR